MSLATILILIGGYCLVSAVLVGLWGWSRAESKRYRGRMEILQGEAGRDQWLRDLTWSCHACEEARPDALISVVTMARGERVGTLPFEVNFRYCNDRPACYDRAVELATAEVHRIEAIMERHGI